MAVKYTKTYLNRLEDLFSETDYILRYEKGSFQSGYCLLKETKVAVVNKFYPVDGKINCLLDILKSIEVDRGHLSEKNQHLWDEIQQTALKL